MMYDLTGLTVSSTYQRLVQYVDDNFYDGFGNTISIPIGPTGANGLGFTWLGDWDESFFYDINDVVKFSNDTYVCVSPISSVPSTSPNISQEWDIYIEGVIGPTGPQGLMGPTGPQGLIGPTGSGGTLGNYGTFYDTTNQTTLSSTQSNTFRLNSTLEARNVLIEDFTKIKVLSEGTYNLEFSAHFVHTSNNSAEVDIWLSLNGQNLEYTNSRLYMPKESGSFGYYLPSWNYMRTLNANDYLEIKWRSSDTNVFIQYLDTETNPDRPELPSIYLTIQQIMYTQLGPTGPTGPIGPTGLSGDSLEDKIKKPTFFTDFTEGTFRQTSSGNFVNVNGGWGILNTDSTLVSFPVGINDVINAVGPGYYSKAISASGSNVTIVRGAVASGIYNPIYRMSLGTYSMATSLYFPVLPDGSQNYTWRYGVTNATGNLNNSAYVQLSLVSGVPRWSLVTTSGGASTTDTNTVMTIDANTHYKVELIFGNGAVYGKIDNIEITVGGNISNIPSPTSNYWPFYQLSKTFGTGNRTVFVDWHYECQETPNRFI